MPRRARASGNSDEQSGGIMHRHIVRVIRLAQRHLAEDVNHVLLEGTVEPVERWPPLAMVSVRLLNTT